MKRRVRAAMLLLAVFMSAVASGCAATRGAESRTAPETLGVPPSIWRRAPAGEEAMRLFAEAKRQQGLGRTLDAYAAVTRAIDAEPDFLEAHRLLQDLLARTTADWWLRKRYEKIHSENPDAADGWYYLARLETDPARQLALFEEALARDPGHPYAELGRAIALARMGRHGSIAETLRCTERAPWLALPWIYLGAEALRGGEPAKASYFYANAANRASHDARAWLGMAQAADDLGHDASASQAAVVALRLAPGDDSIAGGAVEILVRSSVPADLEEALAALGRALSDGADPGTGEERRGRLLLALGRADAAEAAFCAAVASGMGEHEVSQPLRLARVLAGRWREAVSGALADLPREAHGADNLYAPRWGRLRVASASADVRDARSLLRLAEAMSSVGWLDEARAVLTAARAAAPGDPVVAARAASEMAFGAFVDDIGRVARSARQGNRSADTEPSVSDLLDRISDASWRRLGFDASAGAGVRRYTLLGEFAASVASEGPFETTFGAHGLLCLLGARSNRPAELVLGRIALLRASAAEEVLGEPIEFDECWLESEGLPSDAAGLRRGLAGLTLDRFVMLQLDVIRRAPPPLESGLPFEMRPAGSRADARALDTPSDVASRIERCVSADGRLEGAVLDAVRRHELIHVHDATRMLPLHENLFTVLTFGLRHGFDSATIERALEGRAQALSLKDTAEPRIALAALVAFLPAREGETPHAAAYREAIEYAIDVILDDPPSFPSIDVKRNVVQQLDALTDAEIRVLGERIARRF